MLKDVETLSCLLSPASSWHLTDKAHNELLSIFLARDQSVFTIRILLHSRPSVALHLFLKFRFLKIMASTSNSQREREDRERFSTSTSISTLLTDKTLQHHISIKCE